MKELNLSEIRKAIKNIDRERRKRRKERKFKLRNNVNKNYRFLDWSKNKLSMDDLKGSIENTALPVFRKMRDYKWVRCQDKNYYLKSNIENLFLLQELMCQMDEDYWFPSEKSKNKSQSVTYVPYHFDSKYLGKCYLCSIPKTLEWKVELLTEFLKSKEFIFDERTPFGRPLKDIRKFVGKTLVVSKVEKWDYYFHRFLHEKR